MKPIKQEYLDKVYEYICIEIEEAIIKTLDKAWYNIDKLDKNKINVRYEEHRGLEETLKKIKTEWYLEWKFNI